jgi:hypothetical protein
MSDLGRDVETGGPPAGAVGTDPGGTGTGADAPVVTTGTVPGAASTPGTGGSGDAKKEAVAAHADSAKEEARDVASTASEQGRQVAETAKEGAREVAQDASEQLHHVAETAAEEATDLVAQAFGELRSQADAQAGRAAAGLHGLSSQLTALADGRPEEAGPAADYARQITSRLDELASRIDQRGVDGVVEDVTRFARRRPGAFLAGAAAAGFLASRLFRGNQAAQDQGGQGQQRSFPTGDAYGARYGSTGDIDLTADVPAAPLTGEVPAAPLGTPATTAGDVDARRQYGRS